MAKTDVAAHGVAEGVTYGNIIAGIISFVKWHSISWAILHTLFGWAYVLYYIIQGY